MLEGVITSKTKANILVKLFLNPGTRAYLRSLAKEFGVSSNAVRTELNTLKKHKILTSEKEGRNIIYRANTEHPLFPELSSMVRKITGIDRLVQSVVERLGNLEGVYVTGDYAEGRDTGIIDVLLVGNIDKAHLGDIVGKTERYINRRIRPLVLLREEFETLNARGSFGTLMNVWAGSGTPPEARSESRE